MYFRAETEARARQLGLRGFVRNLPDGSVEAAFEGPQEKVELIVRWCGRGPRGAHVASVDVDWGDPIGELVFRTID